MKEYNSTDTLYHIMSKISIAEYSDNCILFWRFSKQSRTIEIKNRRKKLLLTQEVVAEHLGISVKHFSEVERGIAGLSIENLINLSNILGLSVDYISKGDSNISECESTLSLLQNVPKEKEEQIKNLIRIGIDLIN